MPAAVIVVFEGESETPLSLIEELGRSRILRSLYFNGLRNQRVKTLSGPVGRENQQDLFLKNLKLPTAPVNKDGDWLHRDIPIKHGGSTSRGSQTSRLGELLLQEQGTTQEYKTTLSLIS
ncbi:hypothetical protein AVEN_76510-1 [Araneus ventricosus]|uniref:Uncharacterized protein n=1 Tax=Araneus ventricosus TaxID=182803 RepID=A0A4Y2CEV0_ARAVE|nr:hypothetical protein AVEN_76510-1 [Araneus ventricosus]